MNAVRNVFSSMFFLVFPAFFAIGLVACESVVRNDEIDTMNKLVNIAKLDLVSNISAISNELGVTLVEDTTASVNYQSMGVATRIYVPAVIDSSSAKMSVDLRSNFMKIFFANQCIKIEMLVDRYSGSLVKEHAEPIHVFDKPGSLGYLAQSPPSTRVYASVPVVTNSGKNIFINSDFVDNPKTGCSKSFTINF